VTLSDSTISQPVTRAIEPRSIAAIVVAAGRGQRFGAAENKVLRPLAGMPIWVRAVEALQASAAIGKIVLVIRGCDRPHLESEASRLGVAMVEGGEERYDSVKAGLDWLLASESPPAWIAVHDAARPLVPTNDLEAVFASAVTHRAALLATPVRGTLKRGRIGEAITTVDRTNLWEALTPQVFAAPVLQAAYARHRGRPATDDAELVERTGVSVCLVPGSAENIKITCAEDLQIAEAIFSRRMTP
jgi:2-C-methyl-D-erythritol 4-phosphate cytidylyltransferase